MEVVKFRGILTSLRKEFVYGVGFLKSPCVYDFFDNRRQKAYIKISLKKGVIT